MSESDPEDMDMVILMESNTESNDTSDEEFADSTGSETDDLSELEPDDSSETEDLSETESQSDEDDSSEVSAESQSDETVDMGLELPLPELEDVNRQEQEDENGLEVGLELEIDYENQIPTFQASTASEALNESNVNERIVASLTVENEDESINMAGGNITGISNPVKPQESVSPPTTCSMSVQSQTTPSLQDRCSKFTKPNGDFKPESQRRMDQKTNDSDGDSEEQACPICFDPWSNSGAHRLSSLNCGHLFGRSCIEKWLKGKSSDKCPQCNCPAKRKDVRNIYAKAVKTIDTSERDRAVKELESEKLKRTKAQESEARAVIQLELAKAELENLKRELQENNRSAARQRLHQGSVASTSTQRFPSSSFPGSSQYPSSQYTSWQVSSNPFSSNQSTSNKSYVLQKTIQVAPIGARVMAYDRQHYMMAVSKPSPNQLFPGFGVVKVSSLESRSSEYVSIHQKLIRDMAFNGHGNNLLLTASVDKSLKMTSMVSNTVVQSYTCPAPVWCCDWNQQDPTYIYCGLQNGQCLVFDVRKTGSHLSSLEPPNTRPCPVVSLTFVQKRPGTTFSPEGLLVGTLNGGWFWEHVDEGQYISHKLNFGEGSVTGLCYEISTQHCLLSLRPTKQFTKTQHFIYRLTGSGIGRANVAAATRSLCTCEPVMQCVGGNISKLLTRSRLFTCPGDQKKLMVAAGDEATNTAFVWDGSTGRQLQKLPLSEKPILDISTFYANGSNFLATLSEQKLNIHRWESVR